MYETYILIPANEAIELSTKAGFLNNSYPRCTSMPQNFGVDGYFIRREWYDEVSYNDYVDSLKK